MFKRVNTIFVVFVYSKRFLCTSCSEKKIHFFQCSYVLQSFTNFLFRKENTKFPVFACFRSFRKHDFSCISMLQKVIIHMFRKVNAIFSSVCMFYKVYFTHYVQNGKHNFSCVRLFRNGFYTHYIQKSKQFFQNLYVLGFTHFTFIK